MMLRLSTTESMQKILIASQNAHKIDEIAPFLQQAGFDVTDARAYNIAEPAEDSGTFLGNVRIKARYYADATGLGVLADDSGLIVDSLGDFPGVESAPFIKSCGGNAQAVADLFKRLDGRSPRCHYISVLLLRFPDGREVTVEGKVYGTLVSEPRGNHDFGFDCWFLVDGDTRTFGEYTTAEKNAVSHRGLALQNLLKELHELRAVS